MNFSSHNEAPPKIHENLAIQLARHTHELSAKNQFFRVYRNYINCATVQF